MSSSLVNSLAKVYDPNPLHGQKPGGRKLSLSGSEKFQATSSSSSSSSSSFPHDAALRSVESRMDSLSSQMERLLSMQHTVLTRLDGLCQDVGAMGRDLASMSKDGHGSGGGETSCRGLRGAVESQGRRLDGVERLVEGTQQVISFIGEVVKSSRLVEVLFKRSGNKSNRKAKDDKDKAKLSVKGSKAQKKRKPQDTEADVQRGEDRGRQETAELILDGTRSSAAHPQERKKDATARRDEEGERDAFGEIGPEEEEQKEEDASSEDGGKEEDDVEEKANICKTSLLPQESSEDASDVATCSKRRVTEEDLVKDDLKKSRVEGSEEGSRDGQAAVETGEPQASKSDEGKTDADEAAKEADAASKEFVLDLSPPPVAPFDHRIVTPKPHQIATYYSINREEVLGGGRFGQVHKCTENSSGLTLAAKIIKARSQKEKDVVRNEIQVMNQLNHANLIQLYAAFESRHDIILVMEYVEGGELFDRIIDENYNLTELDTVLFIRQICEGLQYMHKMYILHLDLKPENILCVSRATNKIKIIDFGLARRYKPREKLKVNFGTPEFLAPEVINYEFVSFPTDMWSLGVITYMLLSGLSPFLGDDDNETLNNILACQWNFEEEEFTDISDEAKDFITRLLVKSKSWRMSATESLRHPWLSDRSLHYRLNQKKTKCHSTHAPPPES
ncbi:myosin light chain kinase family member 4 isoform X2 [Mugil cephalus]|uniref:myosin light chain kinase family member 4 isoform X2 n=1 Tax=Mugil cephalus TaxID=48193 RepID=UPI001FB66CF5|nr:myosin light chain kinase family member 4 isoform X2 [Mugil cephalus]